MNPEAWKTIRWIVVIFAIGCAAVYFIKLGFIDKHTVDKVTNDLHEISKNVKINIGPLK